MHMCVGANGFQKVVSDLLELVWQAFVSCLTWVL